MIRIYVRQHDEPFGRVFKSKSSVKNDKVAILSLPLIGEAEIDKEKWAKSQQTICEALGLYISETEIDGRSKLARNMKYFSWKDIINMRKNRSDFKPMGYKTISNCLAITIEISNCGSMLRYRVESSDTDIDKAEISDWLEIHFNIFGEPYFNIHKGKMYLSEFMKM